MKTFGHKKHILLLSFLLLPVLIQVNNLFAQDVPPPSVVLSSYTVIGNPLADDVITLNLVLTNTSRNMHIYDALFSYTSENDAFFPPYGQSNQFLIPVIRANSSVEYELKISVQDVLPNESLHLNFDAIFIFNGSDIGSSGFFLKNVIKSRDAIQLLGIRPIEAERHSDNYRIASFRTAVINQSNFIVQNAVMILEGVNFNFTTAIPLNNISPGNYAIRYFNLNFVSEDIPEFIVKFQYNDTEGFEYESIPKRFSVDLKYSSDNNDTPNRVMNSKNTVRNVLFILAVLALIAGSIFLLIKLSRKKGV